MRKYLFLVWSLLITTAMYAQSSTDLMQQDLFSNYGGWVNLTAGYTHDTIGGDPIKAEMAVSGQTVHVVWAGYKSNGHERPEGYGVWYRRSTDNGETWEDARSLYQRRDEFWNGESNIIAVDGNDVHMVVPDNKSSENPNNTNSMLVYLHSADGGATFQTTYLDTVELSYHSVSASVIRVDGNNVIVASKEYHSGSSSLVVYRSTDNGATFRRTEVELPNSVSTLGDLQLKGNQWAVLWSYVWNWDAAVYVTTGTMTGDNCAHSLISPQVGDRHYGYLRKLTGLNGSDFNFHPLMAITGSQTLHVLFMGLRASGEEEGDPYRTFYVRSDDFGQTWGEIKKLDNTRDQHATLVAKGQNVYAVVGSNYNRWIAYSNDGGDTWQRNTEMCYGSSYGSNYDSPNAYEIVLDPNDPTGNHAWYIGCRWLDIETKDGFQSLCRAHRADGSIGTVSANRGSQFAPLLAIDSQGVRHMVMRHMVDKNDYGQRFVPQLFYRRESGEPAPAETNMAIHMHRSDADDGLQHRIAIPMSENLRPDSAMTVAFWVKVDRFGGSGSLVSLHSNISGTADNQEYSAYYPGFYIATTNPYRSDRLTFEACITTDQAIDGKGVIFSHGEYNDNYGYSIRDTGLWHSVVLTFNGKKTDNNAGLYIDGFKVCTRTVSGSLVFKGSNPIIIGNGLYYNHDWTMDDFRIWNRALTEEEVSAFANRQDVSYDGCLVRLDFDGTLKDLSGLGNDAISQMTCEFTQDEAIQVPMPKMQIAKDITGRTITFTDQTENGETYWWFYNDQRSGYTNLGNTSRHTQYTYQPGEYEPVLIARSHNACAAVKGHLTVYGLNKVIPSSAGQAEGVHVKIYGGYVWRSDLNVRLHKAGQADIIGTWVKREGYDDATSTPSEKLHYASFDISTAELGTWDVIVGEDTLKQAFTVEPFQAPDVWAQINGWGKVLIDRYKDFAIEYGNRGNADAYNVPFYLFVSEAAEVSLGFESPLYPENFTDAEARAALDTMRSVVFDAGMGYGKIRAYSFLIPCIRANSRYHLDFAVKSDVNFSMYYYIGTPWGPLEFDAEGNPIVVLDEEQQEAAPRRMPMDEWDDIERGNYRRFDNKKADCAMKYLGWGVVDATMGSVPLLGCAYQVGLKIPIQGLTDSPEDRLSNLTTNLFSAAFTCAMDINPLGWGFKAVTLANAAFNTAMNIYSAKGCMDGGGGGKDVKAVGSYDPNEMIGPDGYGDEHFIQPAPEMSYTITFENKSTATAPAHEVFVSDTLDATRYDFASFGFTSFGWADTIIRVDGQKMKEFVQDIDLRPATELIVRVSGTFDEQTGIARWSFVSLNPQTKQYEEDPDLGFLVPNNANHDGEGFVCFAINHLADLSGGTAINNEATIIFDANEAIKTNNYTNVLDTDAPTSQAISAVRNDEGKVVVTWSASDATSGIAAVDLYQSVDGAEYEFVTRVAAPLNTATLELDRTKKYCFATIAHDNVGWQETKPVSEMDCEARFSTEDIIQIGDDKDRNGDGNEKMIRDGHLYIILQNGKTYNAQGIEIK